MLVQCKDTLAKSESSVWRGHQWRHCFWIWYQRCGSWALKKEARWCFHTHDHLKESNLASRLSSASTLQAALHCTRWSLLQINTLRRRLLVDSSTSSATCIDSPQQREPYPTDPELLVTLARRSGLITIDLIEKWCGFNSCFFLLRMYLPILRVSRWLMMYFIFVNIFRTFASKPALIIESFIHLLTIRETTWFSILQEATARSCPRQHFARWELRTKLAIVCCSMTFLWRSPPKVSLSCLVN